MTLRDGAQSEHPPLPPTDLMARVIPPFGPDAVEQVRRVFHTGGKDSLDRLEQGLAAVGRRFDDFPRILDFGCGPSRIMRHLGAVAPDSELHGTDIDADVIAWSAENVPFARFTVGPHEPPLPYDAGSFDLVYNHSVFTHIDERMQDLWLAEIRRLLVPGGIALLTVHSTRQFADVVSQLEGAGEDPAPYRETLERDGILFIADDGFVGTTHPDWYHSTFHAPWYVYERWNRFMQVRAHLHEGAVTQDLIVLVRRPDGDDGVPVIGRGAGGAVADAQAPQEPAAPAAPQPAQPVPPASVPARAAPRVLLGRAKRRLLQGEHVRMSKQERELAETRAELERLRAEAATAGGGEDGGREIAMLRAGLYAQAERISIIERELREEIARLRREGAQDAA